MHLKTAETSVYYEFHFVALTAAVRQAPRQASAVLLSKGSAAACVQARLPYLQVTEVSDRSIYPVLSFQYLIAFSCEPADRVGV